MRVLKPLQHRAIRLRRDLLQRAQLLYSASQRGAPARLPDFLCIGAPRCGTTWLHHQLSQLPGVFLPAAKEVHFLDDVSDGGEAFYTTAFDLEREAHWRWYALQYRHAGNRVAGDITPTYAVASRAHIARVAHYLPQVKIIYVMRNPVERAWSGVGNFLYKKHGLDLSRLTEQALLERTMLEGRLRHGRYRQVIENWEAVFEPERIHYVLFDQIRAQPDKVLQDIARFLALPAENITATEMGQKKKNSDYPKMVIPPAAQQALADHYAPDIRFVLDKFGLDATAWQS